MAFGMTLSAYHLDSLSHELLEASNNGDLEKVKRLCEQEGYPFPKVSDNKAKPTVLRENTPLHRACWHGHLKIVKYLVEEVGCDIYHTSSIGWTAVHSSCVNGHLHILKYFLEEKKCDTNMVNDYGWTLLHTSSWAGRLSIVQYLVKEKHCKVDCRDKMGNTALHWCCMGFSALESLNVMEYLLTVAGCDPNITTNSGESPLLLLGKHHQGYRKAIQLLLYHKATPPHPSWEKIYLEEPLEAFSKLLLMGFPQAGKSTLAKSLRTEIEGKIEHLTEQLKHSHVIGVKEDTSGIVSYDFKNKRFGNMTVYDLAGQSEYYSSHDLALRSVLAGSPSSIIVLVTDVTKGIELVRKSLLYWCNFASNLFECSSRNQPFLIVIGSYADQVSSSMLLFFESVVKDLMGTNRFPKIIFKGFVALDCRYAVSAGMTVLRSHVAECCQILKESQVTHFRHHLFLIALTDTFPDKPAFTINDIISANSEIRSTYRYMNNPSSILEYCVELNKKGHLLFLHNKHDVTKSWIVFQKELLLEKISGSIFAPKHHREHKSLASDTGIVPALRLVEEFPDIDCDLIISFMTHFQFCHEVTDPEVLTLLSITQSNHCKYFFFPSLVTISTPEEIWEDQSEFQYQSVSVLECCSDEQFLSSTFMHVTVHHFALSYAMAPRSTSSSALSIHRRCKVWKNGIYWCSLQGIDVVVEIDSKRVILYIRARKACALNAVKLRSELISIVFKTKAEYCRDIELKQYLVKSMAPSFPMGDDMVLVPLADITHSLVKCEPYCFDAKDKLVELEPLLYFEPFANLGEGILNEIFIHPQQDISNEFLLKFAEKAYCKMKEFVVILDSPAQALASDSLSDVDKFYRILEYWRDRNPTYSQLQSRMAVYSIFAGRNPLMLLN